MEKFGCLFENVRGQIQFKKKEHLKASMYLCIRGNLKLIGDFPHNCRVNSVLFSACFHLLQEAQAGESA